MLLCHIQSKVARKSRFDGEQTCRLAFIFLICFGGGGGRVLGFVLFLISLSWFRPCNVFRGLDHVMQPKKGHRIPKEANLTEWETNPESHVFVDWHPALGVEC